MKTKIELEEIVRPPCWEMTPPDFYKFLRLLPVFAPSKSVLCLEGVHVPDIEAFLLERPAVYENKTNQGFLRMRSKIFYMPITGENLRNFASLAERYAEPEICDHLQVYRNDKIILSWHDLPSDPVYLSNEIEESVVKQLCENLRCEYGSN